MAFNPSDDYDSDKLCLCVEGEFQGRSLKAFCSPDSEGNTYFEDGTKAGGPVEDQHGAPFKVDIVLYESVYPNHGEMANIRDEVGDLIQAQFDGKIDNIFDKISGADDPFEAIMDTSAEEL